MLPDHSHPAVKGSGAEAAGRRGFGHGVLMYLPEACHHGRLTAMRSAGPKITFLHRDSLIRAQPGGRAASLHTLKEIQKP